MILPRSTSITPPIHLPSRSWRAVQPCVPGLPPCEYPTPFSGVTIPLVIIAQAMSYTANTTPFVMQYNFGIQREIAPDIVLDVSYIGSQGYNLLALDDINPSIPNIVNGVANLPAPPPVQKRSANSTPTKKPSFEQHGLQPDERFILV